MALLNVQIEDYLLREFKKFAVQKHGRIYRVLGPEVAAALVEHMKAERPLSGDEL